MSVTDSGRTAEGPKLTGEGAKLLAEVLNDRALDRHDTLTARRNALRRESDALRHDPESSLVELAPPVSSDLDKVDAGALYEPKQPRSAWLLLVLFVMSLGVGIWLAAWVNSRPTAVDFGSEDPIADAQLSETAEAVTVEGVVEIRSSDGEPIVTPPSSSVADLEDGLPLPQVSADDLEVMVYDNAPSNGAVYSFALRIKSLNTTDEFSTSHFVIQVEGVDGVPAQTFTRFVHDTLPPGTSALATVRAEGASPSDQVVAVWLNGVEMARIPIARVAE